MTRAGAIIGSVMCGWLSLGIVVAGIGVASGAQQAVAQTFGGGASGGGFAEAAAGGTFGSDGGMGGRFGGSHTLGDDVVADTGTPQRATDENGESLIEQLNHALENALKLRGLSGSAPPAPPAPDATMPLAARADAPASRGPVVVELFTSQGCSSCPPADEMFLRYAERPDVIALALHVDYWDYLGWEDPFAQPAFTSRQKAYARAAHSRSIYTPQMFVEGGASLIGADDKALDSLIATERARPAQIAMTVSGSEGRYTVELGVPQPLETSAVVQIVRYAPQARVQILRGENAGMVIDYANVVTAWHAVAEWDGRTATRLNVRIDGDQPAVIIVQGVISGKSGPLPGPILAAGRLN